MSRFCVRAFFTGLSILVGACAQGEPDGSTSDDDVALATVELALVPPAVQCVIVGTMSGSASTSTPLALTPNTQPSLIVPRPKPGLATFTAEAYSQACSTVTGSSSPSWSADPVTTEVRPGVPTRVMLAFRRNYSVGATATFVDNLAALTVGPTGSLALTAEGSWLSWGNVPAFADAPAPVAISNPASSGTWRDVRLGRDHGCALSSTGLIKCFGACSAGQSGTTADCAKGYSLSSGPNLWPMGGVSVGTGDQFGCATFDTGALACWGKNTFGQLGDGTTVDTTTQLAVVRGVSESVRVAVGGSHACVLTRLGHVYCWGNNASGQLGINNTTNQLTAVRVAGEEAVMDVVAGEASTCALRADGTVRCWGLNSAGTVGDGTTANRLVPTLVQLPLDAIELSMSSQTTCALLSDRTVRCWGRNSDGAVGDETATNRLVPTQVVGLPATGIDRLAASSPLARGHCAYAHGGNTYCWGFNTSGQLGDGTKSNRFEATPVKL